MCFAGGAAARVFEKGARVVGLWEQKLNNNVCFTKCRVQTFRVSVAIVVQGPFRVVVHSRIDRRCRFVSVGAVPETAAI
jgi:hypothetical protein